MLIGGGMQKMHTKKSRYCLSSNFMRNKKEHLPKIPLTRDINDSRSYPKILYILWLVFAGYLVLPIIDLPFLGLSLSAPLFFIIAIVVIVRPAEPWLRKYGRWVALAVFIWLGIFISTTGNGLLSGGVAISTSGIATVIQYAYWLLVFVVTAYVASLEGLIEKTISVLGWGVFILGLARWIEVLIFENIGAWTGTHLISQNSYGLLFSTFSPFLFLFISINKGIKRLFAIGACIILWGAVVINGSRGSWVSIVAGLVLFFLIQVISRPRKVPVILIGLAIPVTITIFLFTSSPVVMSAVGTRFNTFSNLETDKSYQVRQLMIQKGLRLFEQSPILGVGADNFNRDYFEFDLPSVFRSHSQSSFQWISAHNSYLGFLSEFGLAASIPFGILLLSLFSGGLSAVYSGEKRADHKYLAVLLSFIQMSIHMWTNYALTNTGNWFIYGLVAAVIILNERIKKP